MLNSLLRCTGRLMSTSSRVSAEMAYPFSKSILTPEPPPAPTDALRKGKGLMAYVNEHMVPPEKKEMVTALFGRKSPTRLLPGSVLVVQTNQAPYSFSGVLVSMRRRGLDTSILLRNIVQRMGVEMLFFVNSPDVKSITVIQRAGGGKKEGKRMRRAKLHYLRHSPEKMSAISAGLKIRS